MPSLYQNGSLVLIECVVLDVLPLPKSVSATNGLAALPPQSIDTAPLVPPDAIGVIVIVYGPSISNQFSYYYAEGGGLVWAGPFSTCATNNVFDWCMNTCSSPGRTIPFRELDTGSASNYTLTFVR
jgi:hypothetical protein